MTYLPGDPAILSSYLNTLLRDRYASLEELTEDLDLDPDELHDRLSSAGLSYDPLSNRIR